MKLIGPRTTTTNYHDLAECEIDRAIEALDMLDEWLIKPSAVVSNDPARSGQIIRVARMRMKNAAMSIDRTREVHCR